MFEPIDFDIEIKDLPPEESLTAEEKEQIAGAGPGGWKPSGLFADEGSRAAFNSAPDAQQFGATRIFHEHLAIFQECIDFTQALARECSCQCAQGPIKSLESALRKANLAPAMGGYGGDLTQLKDLLRFTIVAPDAARIQEISNAIPAKAQRYGWGVHKNNVVPPTLDNSGNGGLNAALKKRHAFGEVFFEIQANTPKFLYGKESEQGFNSMMADNTGQTRERMKAITKVAGGLGHVLYEIVRGEGAASQATRDQAKRLSYAYYQYLRGPCNSADPGYAALCTELTAFVNSAEVVPYFKGHAPPANVAVFPQARPAPAVVDRGLGDRVEVPAGTVAQRAAQFGGQRNPSP